MRKLLLCILFFLLVQTSNGQPNLDLPLKLSLEEVVNLAKAHSSAALQALTAKETNYWQWRTFKSDYKPQLMLDGNLPDFSKTNQPVVQPEGNIEFRSVSNDNSIVRLNLSQNISLTGGQFFIGSYLQRFTDFDRRQTRYNGNPMIVGFRQPLFAFNPLRWDRKIEPLRYEESQKKYVQDVEIIAREAATYFFDLLIAQINLETAQKNHSHSDTIYKIAQVYHNLGRLPRNELLQLKLSVLTAQKGVAQAKLDVETNTLQLKSFIGYLQQEKIELILPDQLPDFTVDEPTALRQARQNRHQAIAFKRILLEAQRDLAKAKGDNGLNASLTGTFGLTNRASSIPGIYESFKDQQTLRIGFLIPVLDWGKSTSRVKTAEANQKWVQYSVNQDEINFDREIYKQVKQFNMLREQMPVNREADYTAQERYEISRNRYLVGDLKITDLTIAQQEKDQARRDYILSLRQFWQSYYLIRILTLYDFKQGQPLSDYYTQ